jgi:hypothetical protein
MIPLYIIINEKGIRNQIYFPISAALTLYIATICPFNKRNRRSKRMNPNNGIIRIRNKNP